MKAQIPKQLTHGFCLQPLFPFCCPNFPSIQNYVLYFVLQCYINVPIINKKNINLSKYAKQLSLPMDKKLIGDDPKKARNSSISNVWQGGGIWVHVRVNVCECNKRCSLLASVRISKILLRITTLYKSVTWVKWKYCRSGQLRVTCSRS